MSERQSKSLIHLWRYLSAILVEGVSKAFTAFEVLGIAFFICPQLADDIARRGLARAVGGTVFLVSFLLANFIVYRKQRVEIDGLRAKVKELASVRADIHLILEESGVSWPPDVKITDYDGPFPDVQVARHGFRPNGVPGWIYIWAEFRAENEGYEEGSLVCELDTEATSLPKSFHRDLQVVPSTSSVFTGSELHVPARKPRHGLRFELAALVVEQEAGQFACAMAGLEEYSICVKYHTKPTVGEIVAHPRRKHIEGSLSAWRDHVLDFWHRNSRYNHLAKIAETRSE